MFKKFWEPLQDFLRSYRKEFQRENQPVFTGGSLKLESLATVEGWKWLQRPLKHATLKHATLEHATLKNKSN